MEDLLKKSRTDLELRVVSQDVSDELNRLQEERNTTGLKDAQACGGLCGGRGKTSNDESTVMSEMAKGLMLVWAGMNCMSRRKTVGWDDGTQNKEDLLVKLENLLKQSAVKEEEIADLKETLRQIDDCVEHGSLFVTSNNGIMTEDRIISELTSGVSFLSAVDVRRYVLSNLPFGRQQEQDSTITLEDLNLTSSIRLMIQSKRAETFTMLQLKTDELQSLTSQLRHARKQLRTRYIKIVANRLDHESLETLDVNLQEFKAIVKSSDARFAESVYALLEPHQKVTWPMFEVHCSRELFSNARKAIFKATSELCSEFQHTDSEAVLTTESHELRKDSIIRAWWKKLDEDSNENVSLEVAITPS
eukprot:GHVQ01018117.1.p1 GENE.GHVQ01018117.1~~GHVQ01018117.1.p1  ORF type:complete len:361 (+),score=37.51 GHVQ01018117.1:295-1377(+)